MMKSKKIFKIGFIILGVLLFCSCQKESCKVEYNSSITYGSFTDDRDDKNYKTVLIGNQIWMAQNLEYLGETKSGRSVDCHIYGQMYSWEEALEASPPGWHLPTLEEWLEFINYLEGDTLAGGKLKEAGTAHWNSPNKGATNSSGFTALPAGGWDANGGGFKRGEKTYFWTDSEQENGSLTIVVLNHNSRAVSLLVDHPIDKAFSVRLIKDD